MADTQAQQAAPAPAAKTPASPKGATAKIGKKPRGPAVSASKKAGLIFSVSRTRKFIKTGNYAPRISAQAPVFLAGAMEYLLAEIIELSGKAAADNNRKRITGRDINLALKNDEEFNKLLRNALISGGGVVPSIHFQLLSKREQLVALGHKKPAKKAKAAKKAAAPAAEAPAAEVAAKAD